MAKNKPKTPKGSGKSETGKKMPPGGMKMPKMPGMKMPKRK